MILYIRLTFNKLGSGVITPLISVSKEASCATGVIVDSAIFPVEPLTYIHIHIHTHIHTHNTINILYCTVLYTVCCR